VIGCDANINPDVANGAKALLLSISGTFVQFLTGRKVASPL
jgi:hypothetical protein